MMGMAEESLEALEWLTVVIDCEKTIRLATGQEYERDR